MPKQKRTRPKTAPQTARVNTVAPLAGKTALVTGAGQGVGKGIALTLARAGCTVAINYISDPELANETVRELQSLGVESFAIKADVRSSAHVNRMFTTLRKNFTRLDLLVNNAGTQAWAPLLELKEAEWDRDIATNLKGTFLCLQAAARWMKETGGGSIINIGSGSNMVPFPRLVSYTASKGGIEMLTRVAATELGRFRIRVNCVAPGAILIDRTAKEDPRYAKIWGRQASLGRVGLPQDVGNAVVFLASDQAEFVTAQTLWIDGAAFTQPSWPYKLNND
jgi:NAD(P)-dependent dehydrogenase (short-subunit alcohol dehydrogenase family)